MVAVSSAARGALIGALAASLKRYPDTNPDFFRILLDLRLASVVGRSSLAMSFEVLGPRSRISGER